MIDGGNHCDMVDGAATYRAMYSFALGSAAGFGVPIDTKIWFESYMFSIVNTGETMKR